MTTFEIKPKTCIPDALALLTACLNPPGPLRKEALESLMREMSEDHDRCFGALMAVLGMTAQSVKPFISELALDWLRKLELDT